MPPKKRQKGEELLPVTEAVNLRRSGRHRKPVIVKPEVGEDSEKDITASEESSDEFRCEGNDSSEPEIEPKLPLKLHSKIKRERAMTSLDNAKFSFKPSTIPKPGLTLSDEESDIESQDVVPVLNFPVKHNTGEELPEEKMEWTADAWSTHIDALAIKFKPETKIKRDDSDANSVAALLKLGENLTGGSSSSSKKLEIPTAVPSTSGSVQITIQAPADIRKKKGFDVEGFIKKQLAKESSRRQEHLHKVHLLCLVAYGRYLNTQLNSPELLSLALSLVPSQHSYPPKRTNLTYVEKLMGFVRDKFVWLGGDKLKNSNPYPYPSIETLSRAMSGLRVENVEEWAYLFIVFCRTLGLVCRLIISLQPLPLRIGVTKEIKPLKDTKSGSESEDFTEDTGGATEDSSQKNKVPKSKDVGTTRTGGKPKGKETSKRKALDMQTRKESKNTRESDKLATKKKKSSKENSFNLKSRKVISLDSEEDEKEGQVNTSTSKSRRGVDIWVEVYLEEEEKWLSVDVVHSKIDCCRALESGATKPLLYILAFNVNNTVKDVTARYDLRHAARAKRARVNEMWWAESLKPFQEAKTIRSRREDEEMGLELIERPLPTSINDFKNHPLYALQRHLLKFEAIYPSTAVPVGYVRGEAVYARECVHKLHTRETWIKEAKSVRLNEKPYKVTKARPKWDKYTQKKISDQPLELFGSWQVEDYVPPPAVNGVIPRNAYGNVELFQPCMLPKGTRHLQIPGLNRVAKSLEVDCAPAMTGWDFHGGGSHPVFDGFVVCEEHVEMLLDAWQAKQDEQAKHEKEKKEKRVYGNWRKLIKGLLIKQKLQLKYQFREAD